MEDSGDISHAIPPQQERSARYLLRVVEAAERILRRDGADGLTMPAVALEAGVSVGGIYRRFQTKQDLLRAIKDRHLNRSEAAMAEAMASGQQSLGEVVRGFLATLIRGRDHLIGVILENQHGDPIMSDRGQAAAERMRAAFAEALRPFRHEITHADPDAAIDMAFMIAMSVYLRRSRGEARSGASAPWDVVRRELSRAIIAYLQSPEPKL